MPPILTHNEVLVYRLQKLLESAGTFQSVLDAVKRIFQRVPHIADELGNAVLEDEEVRVSERKRVFIELTVEKIVEICSDLNVSQSLGIPHKLSTYVAFLELVLVVRSKSRTWSMFKLIDYPGSKDEPIDDQAYNLRIKLKSEIKNLGQICSIQTEVDSNRIMISVAATKKLKDRMKTQQMLEKSPTKFIAYYPGEPYLYFGSSNTNHIQSALASCLGCEEMVPLDLKGKCISSLRKIRLGRDAKDDPKLRDGLNLDRFSVLQTETQPVDHQENYPILESVSVSYSQIIEEIGIKLDCQVNVAGSDVIGGLHDMVSEGIISDPPPVWISKLSTAGTNKIKLKPGDGGQRKKAPDEESVISRAASYLYD